MMIWNKLVLFLGCALTIACIGKAKNSNDSVRDTIDCTDTVIVRQDITNEIAGSAYRKRANRYFIVSGNDTSDFMVELSESKQNGEVDLYIRNNNYSGKRKKYRKIMAELKTILPKAKSDFNFDSLTTISIGRLISTGDLAINISNEYKEKYGEYYKIENYKRIAEFLLESKLAKDFNLLLGPYSLSVSEVSVEKVFFATKKELLNTCNIETDSTNVPENILDCITWLRLEHNAQQ